MEVGGSGVKLLFSQNQNWILSGGFVVELKMFVCTDCHMAKCLTKLFYCNNCTGYICPDCVKGFKSEECLLVPLCELCSLKQDNAAETELLEICREVEKEHEQQLLSELGGLENFPGGVNMDVTEYLNEKPSSQREVLNFEDVLDFWCNTPWWWDKEMAKQSQVGMEVRDDLKD